MQSLVLKEQGEITKIASKSTQRIGFVFAEAVSTRDMQSLVLKEQGEITKIASKSTQRIGFVFAEAVSTGDMQSLIKEHKKATPTKGWLSVTQHNFYLNP